MVKSTDCCSRGRKFDSQHPLGSSQLSVIPVQGYLMASSSIAYAQNACTHGINKLKVSGKGRAIQEVAGVGFGMI